MFNLETAVNLVYNRILQEIGKVVSEDKEVGTTQSELNKAGQDAFGHLWGGCISLEQWPEICHDSHRFFIMNTLSSSDIEEVGHWLAVHDGKIWDSFNRPLNQIIPKLKFARPFTELIDLSILPQPDSSTDCGERCIAALELYKTLYH